jgi:hypothetical protein
MDSLRRQVGTPEASKLRNMQQKDITNVEKKSDLDAAENRRL